MRRRGGSLTSPPTPLASSSLVTSPTPLLRCTTCFAKGSTARPCSTGASAALVPDTAPASKTRSTALQTKTGTKCSSNRRGGAPARSTSTDSAPRFPKTSNWRPCARSPGLNRPRCSVLATPWNTTTSPPPNFSTASKPGWFKACTSPAKSTAQQATRKPPVKALWRASTRHVPRGTSNPSPSAEAKPTSAC